MISKTKTIDNHVKDVIEQLIEEKILIECPPELKQIIRKSVIKGLVIGWNTNKRLSEIKRD